MTKQVIRVIIVDDEQKIVQGITKCIQGIGDHIQVVDVAYDGKSALESIHKHRPHIVFTDIKMPVMDGLSLAKRIKELYPNINVVIISGFSQFDYAQQAIKHGVISYLLKPISKEKVIDVLDEVQKNLMASQQSGLQREIRVPDGHSGNSFDHPYYSVYLLTFNNLWHESIIDKFTSYYNDVINNLRPNELLNMKGIDDWVIVDDYYVNEKAIVLSHNNEVSPKEIGKRIKRRLEKSLIDTTVSICTHENVIRKEEIWQYAQRLRQLMHQKFIPTKNNWLVLEQDEGVLNMDINYAIKNRLNQNLNKAIKSRELEGIKEEIKQIICFMSKKDYVQRHYEKVIQHMINLLEMNADELNEKDSLGLKSDILKDLHFAKDVESVYDTVISRVSQYFIQHREMELDSKEAILEYVNENFIEINSVEEVAEKFNYNYAYLSRLFKKMTGHSMNKYISHKKINLAKAFMKEHPDARLNEIGQWVGYKDAHYFSRIFKNVTGFTPTEYRNNKIL